MRIAPFRVALLTVVVASACGRGGDDMSRHSAGRPPITIGSLIGVGIDASPESLAKVVSLGARHVRAEINWSVLEPHRGDFRWARFDSFIDAAHASGVDVLGLLDYGNTWANQDPCNQADAMRPPDDFADFTSYAKEVVARYDARAPGTLAAVEIWNEPNAAWRFWKRGQKIAFWCHDGGAEDPRAFGRLVADTADAIASLPLSAQPLVAPGGTEFLNEPGFNRSGPDFMRDAFDGNPGLGARLSAAAFHAYNAYPPVGEPESAGWAWGVQQVQLGDKIAQTRASYERAGFGKGKPLLLTEIGWPNKNGVQYDDQAAFLVRTMLLAALASVDAVYVYTLADSSQSDPNAFDLAPEGNFGLLQLDGTPKPSYMALKALIASLGDFHVTRRVLAHDPNNSAYIVELANGADIAYVVWDSAGDKGFQFAVPQGYRVFSMIGVEEAHGGSLLLDGSPRYLLR
jgi:hypothetical protein